MRYWGGKGKSRIPRRGINRDELDPQTDQAAKLKAEKIKMALEKLKEANVKKLFIKAFSQDGSSKSLLVDEKMSVAQVCRMLTDKNHVRVDPKWAVVEHLPDLYMGEFLLPGRTHPSSMERYAVWGKFAA